MLIGYLKFETKPEAIIMERGIKERGIRRWFNEHSNGTGKYFLLVTDCKLLIYFFLTSVNLSNVVGFLILRLIIGSHINIGNNANSNKLNATQ